MERYPSRRGDGAKAFGLSMQPPDLTTLKARNGVVFPPERPRWTINGREDIKLHVDREMPVWGNGSKWKLKRV